jgi:hypothetical protein
MGDIIEFTKEGRNREMTDQELSLRVSKWKCYVPLLPTFQGSKQITG